MTWCEYGIRPREGNANYPNAGLDQWCGFKEGLSVYPTNDLRNPFENDHYLGSSRG